MMLAFLLLLLPTNQMSAQAGKDSLLVYEAYKDNIRTLEKAKNYERWYGIEDELHQRTAAAIQRLTHYNGESYEPTKQYEREGYGVAYLYPMPTSPIRKNDYTILDRQTKFETDENGKTRVPYVELLYFDGDNHLMKIEKLNPVTLEQAELRFCER